MSTPEIIANYSITPKTLAVVLEAMAHIRQPVMIWGKPGTGKSAICAQVAAKLGARYKPFHALLHDPVEINGLPWFDKEANLTRWAPASLFPPSGSLDRWVINLEELTAAPVMTQAALYQLVLDRAVGEYQLPEGAFVVACGNYETDRGVSHRMPTRSPIGSATSTWKPMRPNGASGPRPAGALSTSRRPRSRLTRRRSSTRRSRPRRCFSFRCAAS